MSPHINGKNCYQALLETAKTSLKHTSLHCFALKQLYFMPFTSLLSMLLHLLKLWRLFSILLIKMLLLTAVDTMYSAASVDWLYSGCCWVAIVIEGLSKNSVHMPKQTHRFTFFRLENLTAQSIFSSWSLKRSSVLRMISQEESFPL